MGRTLQARLPCWDHLSPERYRQEVLSLIRKIEEDYASRWAQEGKEVAGPKAVRQKHPHYRPCSSNRSPAPKVHAATRTGRDTFYESLKYFVAEYREASKCLRNGKLGVPFPGRLFPTGPALCGWSAAGTGALMPVAGSSEDTLWEAIQMQGFESGKGEVYLEG